jgi:hypothetical protein
MCRGCVRLKKAETDELGLFLLAFTRAEKNTASLLSKKVNEIATPQGSGGVNLASLPYVIQPLSTDFLSRLNPA